METTRKKKKKKSFVIFTSKDKHYCHISVFIRSLLVAGKLRKKGGLVSLISHLKTNHRKG